ncbi:MAG TPA: adenylate/guanylate cyclase domain-containing protein [Vicinamibacteria bacterium]|nr:adenylate/guanylate cyclase domain-containing protein [Vicinamibacteria bacterium]
MGSASLFLKDPTSSRFLSGGLQEAESLLGSPLPSLPLPDLEGGRSVYHVKFHAHLHTLLMRYLQSLLREIGADLPPAPRGANAGKDAAEFEAALERTLRSARIADRRLGLVNLCWLAHSRDVADCLREIESKTASVRKLKYSLHPLLSSFYKRLDQSVRRAVEQADPARASLLAGARENVAMVDAVIEDGFAFTEASIAEFDFNAFLASNKRYRLPADVFFEIYGILFKETERRLRENDRGLHSRVTRHMPGMAKEQLQTQAGIVKVMMNAHVLTYLLGDVWTTGPKLLSADRAKAEAGRRRSAEITETFLDLVTGVKRFELISQLREQITVVKFGEAGMDEPMKLGRRLFEFGDSAQVLNNAINATVLFLDLRGFTQTSEGHISERDLTQELYAVFDAFIPHVQRFGGTVDKFLGDGIMITFGTRRVDPLDPLNAVRTAVLCQDTLLRLRREGKTYFKMGIAIHYGRVYVARFIADEEDVQTTVIGRNVNLAGRLSSAAKKPMDEDGEEVAWAEPVQRELQVTIDAAGTLFNEGIAISRDTLTQLQEHLPLEELDGPETHALEYFDEQIGRRLVMKYAGDAKFKGVRSSFPVYEVSFGE